VKISKLETLRVGIAYDSHGPRVGMRPGLKPHATREALMLRMETDDGRVGWGEAFGHFANAASEAAIHSMIGPWLLGKDACDMAALMLDLQRQMFSAGRSGPVFYAISAADIALWDLAAQRAGQPLFRVLGGRSGELTRYASMVRYGGSVEAIRSNCERAHAQGYRAIKLHEHALDAFRAARECVPSDTAVMLDVNCCWSVGEARAVAREIRGEGFRWLEEPVWPPEDVAGMAQVRAEGMTVAAGENMSTIAEFRRAFEAGAVDVIQPSVIKCGGVSAMREVVRLAAESGVEVVPHSPYWGPGYLASAHVCASLPKAPPIETTYVSLAHAPYRLYDAAQPKFTLPDTPGLGFEPDWEVFERCMIRRAAVQPS
jgi:L-alanine-DL-glutamate epimerase-like enolase superfamily enzyme